MAILGKYTENQRENILRTVVYKLKKIATNKAIFSKFINQLLILSRLRNLNELTIKVLQDMPLIIDIEKDSLYKQGLEKGMEKGIHEKNIEIVLRCHHLGYSLSDIRIISGISMAKIKSIIAQSQKKH